MKRLCWLLVLLPVSFAQEISVEAFREAFLAGELTWEEVEARARNEGEVNWFHWGGSEELNLWIEQVVVPDMAELGVAVNTARVPDTRDVVDLVIADAAVGRGLGEGNVDAVWINGENFFTLASQDLLFGAFADKLPNAQYFFFDPADPRSAINLFDNGYPTDLQEVPWASFQYVCMIDTARLAPEAAPDTFAELETYLRENPGRFTYVRPPNYIGNVFVQAVFYAFNPDGTGFRPFQQDASDVDPAELARIITPGLNYLQRIAPFLLGGSGDETNPGTPIYPDSEAANRTFFVNGEVDMFCQFGAFSAAVGIANGTFAESVQNTLFPASGMIANKSFIAIPSNTPNPAAALLLANYLSSPENQASKLQFLGYAPGIDEPLLNGDQQMTLEQASPELLGVTFSELAERRVPETNASLVDVLETVWLEVIIRGSEEPIEAIIAAALASRE